MATQLQTPQPELVPHEEEVRVAHLDEDSLEPATPRPSVQREPR
jgi:hypothetical protein